jgi:CheY-like chemotaxis protein
LYTHLEHPASPALDVYVACHQNDAVISSAETPPAESATRTILVVDDDPSVGETFARLLRLDGFSVTTASSAEAGLQLAENVRPAGIILDMRMPITSGLEFLRLVRSRPDLIETPVVIVTGDHFLAEDVMQELQALGAAVEFKPLIHDQLLKLAQSLVSE